jgi:hypothetical protein
MFHQMAPKDSGRPEHAFQNKGRPHFSSNTARKLDSESDEGLTHK